MSADNLDDTAAPLVEHLAELRTRLLWSVGAFLVGMTLCFVIAKPILGFLLGPIEAAMRELGNPDPVMQYTAPQELLFTYFHISAVGGLALSFPVIGYQLWRFVAPGLYRSEKAAFLPFLVASPLLFLLGASFAHYVITPMAMRFFLGFADLPSMVSALLTSAQGLGTGTEAAPKAGIDIVFLGKVDETLGISLKLIIAFGICFQLPVLLSLMGTAGLVSAKGLGSVRKYAVVVILIVAALATPPDVVSQLILFTAVYGLYEVSIQLVALIERRRKARAIAEGTWDEDEEADE